MSHDIPQIHGTWEIFLRNLQIQENFFWTLLVIIPLVLSKKSKS